jgi:carotenoid cleavage dioxygenase
MTTRPLEQHGMLMAHWEPTSMEGEVNDAFVVKGEIPAELNGTLFRQGFNPRYRGLSATYFPVTSDGMTHSMRLSEGKAYYKNRWVRTPRFLLEDKFGQAMFEYEGGDATDPRFDGFAFPVIDKPETRGVPSGSPNVSVWVHNQRVYAVGEHTMPCELDPRTLDTLGVPSWAKGLPAGVVAKASPEDVGVCAHPKNCPVTGEVFWFTTSVDAPYITIGSYDPSTKTRRMIPIDLPYRFYPHDWIVTRNHIILPLFPVHLVLDNPKHGKVPKVWQPELGTRIAVVPRDGGDIKWFDTFEQGTRFSFHPEAGYERGNHIIAHVPEFPSFPHPSEGGDGGWVGQYPDANMYEWDFNLETGTIKATQLDDKSIEFPWVDQRYYGLEHRYGFSAVGLRGPGAALAFDGVQRFDYQTNTSQVYDFGPGHVVMEPIFAPRLENGAEGDGYLLTYVWKAAENRSDFVILDAQNVDAGPVAVVQLPMRVPLSPHGSWMPAQG